MLLLHLLGDFIVTVTRSNDIPQKAKVRAKRKEINFTSPLLIYSFSSFDDVISFCKFAKLNLMKLKIVFDKNISIYEYKNIYYIVFKNVLSNLEKVKKFCSCAAEFGTYVENADLFECKLVEYGNKVMEKNVISTINKKF